MAGETEWGNQQNWYSTSATYSLVFFCLSPSSQGVLCFGHSLLGSVKLISLAVQLEKQKKRQNFSLGKQPQVLPHGQAVKPAFFLSYHPAAGVQPMDSGHKDMDGFVHTYIRDVSSQEQAQMQGSLWIVKPKMKQLGVDLRCSWSMGSKQGVHFQKR